MGIRAMENRVRRGMTVGGIRVLIVAKQSFVEQNGAHFWHISSKTSWLAGIGLNLFVTYKIRNPDDPEKSEIFRIIQIPDFMGLR